MKKTLPERMEILEALVADTGLADELMAKQRAKLDARRVELARELKALPNPERELSALAKETTRTEADFIKAETAYRDAERVMVEARTRHVVTSQMRDGKRQRILIELERTAPHRPKSARCSTNCRARTICCAPQFGRTYSRCKTGWALASTTSRRTYPKSKRLARKSPRHNAAFALLFMTVPFQARNWYRGRRCS